MKNERISSFELIDIINDKDRIKEYEIVDLRSEKEYEEYHIPFSKNISFDRFMNIKDYSKYFSKNKTIILYCFRGGSSIYAANYIKKYGYAAKSLIGGIVEYRKN